MKRFFLRDQDGGAAVEFGLIAPLLLSVLVGIGTSAGGLFAHHKARQAVSSAAQYVMTVGSDPAAIRQVALGAWADKGEDGDVDVHQSCSCGAAVHACNVLCDDGDYPYMYTRITATMTYTGLGGAEQAINASQTVRTR